MWTYTRFTNTLAHHIFPTLELLPAVSFFVRFTVKFGIKFFDDSMEVHAVILHGFHPCHVFNLASSQRVRRAVLSSGEKGSGRKGKR